MRPNKRIAGEGFDMPKMTPELYTLRRVVIDEIYRIKNTYTKLPRIDVRIVNPNGGTACGYAWLNSNIIHINSKWVGSKHVCRFSCTIQNPIQTVHNFQQCTSCILLMTTNCYA